MKGILQRSNKREYDGAFKQTRDSVEESLEAGLGLGC